MPAGPEGLMVTQVLDQTVGGVVRGSLRVLLGAGTTPDGAVATAMYAATIPLNVVNELLATGEWGDLSPELHDVLDHLTHAMDVAAADLAKVVK